MIIGGDYVFSWWNFIGLNISAVAAILYTRITFGRNVKHSQGVMGMNDTKSDHRPSIGYGVKNSSKEVPGVSVRNKRADHEQTVGLLSTMESA